MQASFLLSLALSPSVAPPPLSLLKVSRAWTANLPGFEFGATRVTKDRRNMVGTLEKIGHEPVGGLGVAKIVVCLVNRHSKRLLCWVRR